MTDLRKLAALDIALLGYRLILAEYVFAVVFSPALGVFVLARGHSAWQILLGLYFVCLGINYIPMLWWTLRIGGRENARREVAPELADRRAMLVPLLPLVWVIGGRGRRGQ